MNFSFIFKALIISFFVMLIVFAISFVSTQNNMLASNNYGVKDSVKESINIAKYRVNGDIEFDQSQLIKSVISNYAKNNNIDIDNITFEIAVDESKNIVTVKLSTRKNLLNADSNSDYIFSYKVVER